MPCTNLDDLRPRKLTEGFHAKFVHSESMTLAYIDIDEGADVPKHSHPHEQVSNVLEGELELVVGNETHRMTPGTVFVIPPHVPHSAHALTKCAVLDVFYPVRQDYF